MFVKNIQHVKRNHIHSDKGLGTRGAWNTCDGLTKINK